MIKEDKKEIRSIAAKVRRACKSFAMSSRSVGYDFHRNPDLDTMCLCASQVLHEQLCRKGFTNQDIWQTDNHAFVVIKDPVEYYILDITHSQFNNPATVFKPMSKTGGIWYYDNPMPYKLYVETHGEWPDGQEFRDHNVINEILDNVA